MRVLLADDSSLILTRMRELLMQNKGVEVVGMFGNGTDTLQALRSLKPDLAIVDIEMPGLSGLEVLSEIRKVDKSLTFVILTLFTANAVRQEAMDKGADYFFSKANGFTKISSLLKTMLAKERRVRMHGGII